VDLQQDVVPAQREAVARYEVYAQVAGEHVPVA
jgi:hypothetical protein